MLKTLTIKNIALIQSVQIDFSNGLNVLSGETGAGKSVIIESLNFVLGAKSDKSYIRSGESECFAKAEFDITDNQAVKSVLDEFEIEYDDSLILSRKLTLDGKNSVKINGESATVGMLKKLTAHLVDVHGQSEHFYLLKSANQLSLLDKFCGEEVAKLKNKLQTEYSNYKNVCAEIEKLGGDESQRLVRIDILNYQINEILGCGFKDGEDIELKEIKEKLIHQEKISNALSIVRGVVKDEGGVSDVFGSAARAISTISNIDSAYQALSDRIEAVYAELDDIGDTASGMLSDLDFGQYDADSIENRLETIKSLKKKYGNDYNEIQTFLNNAILEKEKLENFNEIAEKLLIERKTLESILYKDYCILSNLRRLGAETFTKNVLDELTELGMSKATFSVQFNNIVAQNECEFVSANGFDKIEFMFSANLGEPLKSLSSVISGGEMSRFMLAVKAQTAKYNDISTFIFDEIDAGISGTVAKVVGEKFVKIAKDVQIIAISHLPQISVMADNNLLIVKKEDGQKTYTTVNSLSPEQKINEIIRLVGGDVNSESAKDHAVNLIDAAEKFKKTV
ncbi:MAG: DNA repair protein RecN [Clostridiales bacterium]|nr:DNA repair protein RecN [Clostridiales bacterium]